MRPATGRIFCLFYSPFVYLDIFLIIGDFYMHHKIKYQNDKPKFKILNFELSLIVLALPIWPAAVGVFYPGMIYSYQNADKGSGNYIDFV